MPGPRCHSKHPQRMQDGGPGQMGFGCSSVHSSTPGDAEPRAGAVSAITTWHLGSVSRVGREGESLFSTLKPGQRLSSSRKTIPGPFIELYGQADDLIVCQVPLVLLGDFPAIFVGPVGNCGSRGRERLSRCGGHSRGEGVPPGLTLTLCHGVGCVEVAPPFHLICGRREEEGEGEKKSHQGGDGWKERGARRSPGLPSACSPPAAQARAAWCRRTRRRAVALARAIKSYQ